MDHAANDVLHPIRVFSQDPAIERLIRLACTAKGRTTVQIAEPEPDYQAFHTFLIDKDLPVTGLSNCLHYLEDRYPEPPLFLDTPERRAVTRMALDCVLDAFYSAETDYDQLQEVYKTVSRQRFVAGDHLSIVDLALTQALPDTPEWAAYRARVFKAMT